ncbi:MAG TPA: hypothetical protein VLB90_07165 [Pseudomonadales bacterium]|nr:hypothetical protein [Pseudomonadales bacterium]
MKLNPLLENVDDPYKLEELYQDNPHTFHTWLNDSNLERPDLPLLHAWKARLNYVKKANTTAQGSKALLTTILLTLLALLVIKLPEYSAIDSTWFYLRFSSIIVFSSLIAYFCFSSKIELKLKIGILLGVIACILVMILTPNKEQSDSITMSLLYMPMILFSILGVAFTKNEWHDYGARLRYIRYIGEILIYASVILFGGMVLTGLTVGLFSLIKIHIESWYMEYVVVWGLVSCPVVATYLFDIVLKRESKIASVIANVFSPLFLITVIAYLLVMLVEQKSPYLNREFLITFNGLLLAVWGITVFSISGKTNESSKLTDVINIALVFTTLVINTIALSAIVFRLSEQGITPNRIAVTGANLLIFMHLTLILVEYIKHFKNKSSTLQLTHIIARYLPAYTGWSIIVVILLPIAFNYA